MAGPLVSIGLRTILSPDGKVTWWTTAVIGPEAATEGGSQASSPALYWLPIYDPDGRLIPVHIGFLCQLRQRPVISLSQNPVSHPHIQGRVRVQHLISEFYHPSARSAVQLGIPVGDIVSDQSVRAVPDRY